MSLDASIALLERLQQVGFLELIIVPHQQRAILGLSPPLSENRSYDRGGKTAGKPYVCRGISGHISRYEQK